MDLSSLFGNAFQSVKVLDISSDLVIPLSFPGGRSVPAIEGRDLSSDSSWNCVRVDLFISAEEALASLGTISSDVSEFISVPVIVTHSNGKNRRVLIYDALNRKQIPSPETVHTFVPISILMGVLLINLHNFGIPQRLRFASLIGQSMEVALNVHPKSGLDRSPGKDCVTAMQWYSESNATTDLFEEVQNEIYKQNYRTMRQLIPPNIARTDMRKLLSDGVPKKIADRLWNKKALWLLCMHPADIPKVHIADLRAKYDCHGLDIVELGALWHALPQWEGGSPKAEWRRALKSRLDELVGRQIAGKISPAELRDPAYKGYDDLIIYDPDRQLYRQFGISVTAVGLQPGERRLSVFTSVDPRQSDAAPQTAGPQPVISACHSPNTDNEKECLLRRDMWGRGGDGSSEMPDSPSDSDSDLSIKWDTAKSRKRRRSKKRSPREEEKMTLRSGRERRATVLPLSPISGRVFMDYRATERGREMEREECTDKDKDTELDDLLNYEINLSCLNLDDEIVDCLSAKSRGSSHDDYGGSSWRDVSERLSPSEQQAHDHYFAMGYDGTLAGFSPTSCHSQMRDTLPSATRDGDLLEGSMRIVNFRPFYVPSTIKKPAKRINFIAAAAHTPVEKQLLASVDSLGQANFDNVPDFELSSDKSIKKIGGPSQRKHLLALAPSTSKKRQTRTMPTEILKPWGSTGARRRNSASTTMTCTRHDPSSSAEKIYDENTDVERCQLNPETQSVGRESSKSIEKGSIFNPADIEPSPITTIVLTRQQAGLLTALSSKTIHGDCSSTHGDILTDLAEGPNSRFKSACSTDEHMLLRYHDNSSVSVSDFAVKAEAGTTEQMTSTVKDSAVLLHDELLHSRNVMLENSIGSPLTVSESSRDSSQHPNNDPLAPALKAADSVKANKKFGKKYRVEAHHNQLRAKERQRTLVKELESCIEGTLNESSPSSTIDSVPSPTTFPAPSPSITVATISGPLQFVAPAIPPRTSKGDDQSHKRFVNTFTAVSPKFDRIMSEEEELVDSKIEAEINNFIVPDELSPITLRQFGIEMDIKEVNGIRQNALLSLPALLDEIGRGSKELLGRGEQDVDEDDESFQDLFDTDLGLWGANMNPYIVDESPIEIETDVALIEEDEADPSDSIERLISAGDATSRALLAGGLRKVSHSNPSTVCDGAEAGDILCWVEASYSRNVVSTGETDSEGSCNRNSVTLGLSFSSPALLGSATSEPVVVPAVTLTAQEAEDLILHKEARLAWAALEMGTLSVSRDFASILLLKLADNSDAVVEPLETLVLLVDKLDADVNATNGNMMTPMHSLFSCPALGRFVLSRGGDVLLKDDNGDSVLALCAEYGYNWLLPAFISMHSREAKLLEDRDRAHEYAVVMLTLWGYGTRVSELIEDGLVCFTADEALQLMEVCTNNFENMKEPVETFELLEALILGS